MNLRLMARVAPVAVAMAFVSAASQGAVLKYVATLDGPSESPPVASPGTGMARVDFDTITNMMRVRATFSDLTGVTTVAHIHAPTAMPLLGTAGVATYPGTFPGFPVGVTSGSFDATFDMSLSGSYTAAFLNAHGGTAASAQAALLGYFGSGQAYFNIHTSFSGSGEIRGFLVRDTSIAIPLPTASLMGLAGLGAAGAIRRRRGL